MISLIRRDVSPRVAESTAQPPTWIDRALIAFGIDARVVSSIMGDLAEELAERSERKGIVAARCCWARDAIRSLPHLAHYGIVNSHRSRVVLAATTTLLVTAACVAVRLRVGPADQILLDGPTLAGGLVVNDTRPAQIRARIVDARGRVLRSRGLYYALQRGEGITVSPSGAVACTSNTDAVVSASFEAIVTNIPVACRIVRELRADRWLTLIAGADARALPFVAMGVDGKSVDQVRGAMRVHDSTIVTVDGVRVRPIRPGETTIEVEVAGHTARTRVVVHAVVEHFTDRVANQQFVAVPIRNERGRVQHYALPVGAFWLKYIPRREGAPRPTILTEGPVRCTSARADRFPAGEHARYCVVSDAGAAVLVSTLAAGFAIDGALALERELGPRATP